MTIVTVYDSFAYQYDYDTRHGVGWFVRKSDDYVTLLDTGTDAQEQRDRWTKWNERQDIDTHRKDIIFDMEAIEYSYSPRWDGMGEP